MAERNRPTEKATQESSFLQTNEGGFELPAIGAPLRARAPRNSTVYLVLDCSGSMAGNKLEQAKEGAVEFAFDARGQGYKAGLIAFESSATHLCEPQDNPALLSRFTSNLEAHGGTNMAEAIRLATDKLANLQGQRTMAVVTDGKPDNAEKALAAAEEAKRKGIDIITLGTEDADQAFLRLLASREDLAATTSSAELSEGIRSMANMLPGV